MKKTLRSIAAGVAALLLGGFSHQAEASHFQGGDLTYSCLGPGIYSVSMKLYRDCTGSTAPSSATLNIKSPTCNAGRNITMTKMGGNRIGDPYCAVIPKQCNSTGRTNFEEVTFTALVTFTAAEQACPTWILSWQECCRPSMANLTGQDNFYLEAMVNLTAGINNNSPEFHPINVPIPFLAYNQPSRLSLDALESDGDSLVYNLVQPLAGPVLGVPYTAYNAAVIYNSDSTKYTLTPAGTYSNTFPVFSYIADWTKPMPLVAFPKFAFDSKSGSLGFYISQYDAFSPSVQGKNKYAVAVRIDEYRKLNGVMTKIGSIRRDMMITVLDCGPNQNPSVNAPAVNNQVLNDGDLINLRPGTPMNMQFAAGDGNSNDVVTLDTDVTSVLPGATFTQTPGNNPTATITWTPTAGQVSPRNYYFHITVKDNACPVRGFQTFTFGVKVSATGGVTSVKDGSSMPRFVAYPNPFSETVSFKVNIAKNAAQELVIYNVLGQQVDKISLAGFGAGEQTVTWKASSKMANGQYIAKLISDQKVAQTIQFSKVR